MAKVCMIAYTFYPRDPRVRREAEALASRGDAVDFICLREAGVASRRDYDGVHLYPLSAGRYQGDSALGYMAKYASFFVRSFVLVSWLFFKKRYDLVQVHTMPDFLVFAALVPKLFGAKVILDVHDLMPELYMCKFQCGPRHFIIRLLTWLERCSIGFAHQAIAVHAPHRDALVAHGNEKQEFAILLNVPDPRIFHRDGGTRSDGKFRLIYHGTVARRHGLEVALKAVEAVKERIPNLEFVVIGSGDDLPRIKHKAVEMGLGGCVRFLGTMPVEELPNQLRQADVGLVPILYDAFTRYMLPLKLLEYVGMGIPCIVSETETIRAYFDGEMVRLTKPGDDRELANHILELYEQPEQRARLVAKASAFNAAYNWPQQMQHYFNVVDSLLQIRRPLVSTNSQEQKVEA
jgi:glycosyltransferase involved in cell wall biosynthesis